MKKSQLDNFINFCYNFHIQTGNQFIDNDSDYILEKWNKFIGIKPVCREVNNNDSINKWIKKWYIAQFERQKKVTVFTEEWDKLKEIVDFLSHLNSKPLLTITKSEIWTLEELIELFKDKTGLNIEEINDVEYNHIHNNIKKVINEWKELPVNYRFYKLSQLEI